MREGVVERQGDLYAKTGSKLIEQWHSKYFSQIFPFVMPRMVSGPDFSPNTEERWRRRFDNTPFVSIRQFVGGFARRIEAACRTDWMALPVMRSVAYKWVAEHTMSIVSSFSGKSYSCVISNHLETNLRHRLWDHRIYLSWHN